MKNTLFTSVLLCTLIATHGFGQQLLRPTIGSSGGGGVKANNVYMNQSIGQPYSTKSFYSSSAAIHPGFEQPIDFQAFVGNSNLITLSLFPNPTSGMVTLLASATLSSALLEVYDNGGRKVFEKSISGFLNYKLDCSAWSNGFYHVRITDEQQNVYSSKIVLTK